MEAADTCAPKGSRGKPRRRKVSRIFQVPTEQSFAENSDGRGRENLQKHLTDRGLEGWYWYGDSNPGPVAEKYNRRGRPSPVASVSFRLLARFVGPSGLETARFVRKVSSFLQGVNTSSDSRLCSESSAASGRVKVVPAGDEFISSGILFLGDSPRALMLPS
jgi:hypothetical protein